MIANHLTKTWTPAQLIHVAEEHPPLFAPGTQFSYSTTGYIVLGLLAQRVGGQSYARQLRDYITRPLHLSHTTLPAGATGTLPDVHGYFPLRNFSKTLRLQSRDRSHRRERRRVCCTLPPCGAVWALRGGSVTGAGGGSADG